MTLKRKFQKRGSRLFSGAPCITEEIRQAWTEYTEKLMDSKRMSVICSTSNRNPGRVKQGNDRMLYLKCSSRACLDCGCDGEKRGKWSD